MISTAIDLPVTSKEPVEVVGYVVSLLRERAEELTFHLDLGLTCSSNADLVVLLARIVPSETLGFQIMGKRSETAAEFLKTNAGRFCLFRGTLTKYMSAARALEVIEELLGSRASAIRSAAFMLTAREVRWKGAPAGTGGGLTLFDFKAFKRAARFSLSASVDWPGDDSNAEELKEVLNEISRTTGLPFSQGASIALPGTEDEWRARAESYLAGTICFDEAMRRTIDQLTRGTLTARAPQALRRSAAVHERLDHWGSGRTEKVNFGALVKKQLKEALLGFALATSDAEHMVVARKLGEDTDLQVIIEKPMPKLGKAFTISLGVATHEGTIFLNANLFRFDGTTDEKMWVYGHTSEAQKALTEALAATAEVLPLLEANLKGHFDEWPREIPTEIVGVGAVTAREAYEHAKQAAGQFGPNPRLVRLSNRPRSLAARGRGHLELGFDGRLTANALWWFHFYAPKNDVSFEISVPAIGSVAVFDHGELYRGAIGGPYREALPPKWIDSDAALAVAEKQGGELRRTNGKIFGVLAALGNKEGLPQWEISYLATDDRGRHDLQVHVDAATGAAV